MSARFTSLNRYSNWDGSQNATLNADDLLSALSEDLMEFGDLQQAMRYLMQRGMETSDGNHIKGLRDLVHQLKAEKQQRLERFDMNGVMEDIKRQLEEILGMERDTINEWANRKKDPDDENQENFSNSVLGDIGEQNKEFIKNPSTTFFGRVKGDSMINAGLSHGDLLIIDRSLEPVDNKIAVCFIDGEFTVKRIKIEKDIVWLIAENDKYKPIKTTKDNDLLIWGIVTAVIKSV